MRVRVVVVLFVLVVLAFVTSCGSGSGKSGSTTATTVDPASYVDKTTERSVTIEARDDVFIPQYAKIHVGTTVIFKNAGRNQHNVISAESRSTTSRPTRSRTGAKVRVVFDKVGTHDSTVRFTATRRPVSAVRCSSFPDRYWVKNGGICSRSDATSHITLLRRQWSISRSSAAGSHAFRKSPCAE